MLRITDSISIINGIGPKKLSKFAKLNIYTIKDLLYYYPRYYEDRSKIKKIINLAHDEKITFLGKVCGSPTESITKGKLRVLKVPISDDTGSCTVIFYNSSFFKTTFKKNTKFYFYGKVNIFKDNIQIMHPEFIDINNAASRDFSCITPIYSLSTGITQNDIIKIQRKLVIEDSINIEEYIPKDIIENNKLCDINYAIKNIHFPSSDRALRVSKYRLIFEELFLLQTALLAVKSQKTYTSVGISFSVPKAFYNILDKLPYKLTNAQKQALDDVLVDMNGAKVMNRLIQGDVGSGKTIIALLAMYLAHLNGYQSALMVPTEILAEQHTNTFKELLGEFNINIQLLSSSAKNKSGVLEKISNGNANIIIGTHALIQEKVEFNKLGLVITDEQHRFGVQQRSFLGKKGEKPDVLVMTATPIPRTLSLILYGDLDISSINELPPGRKHIKTYTIEKNKVDKMYKFIMEELSKGRQAYIVCPLIEESDKIDCQSANETYMMLKESNLKSYNLGLIHGQLHSKEKEEIMKDFEKGIIDVLVTTTVIEVGINVPNSTIMVIQNAERFGLSQLHQLRGRVGRGIYQSYCFLITDAKGKIAKERMKIMEDTNDGFLISEKDLELRGPGDFFGTKQHGLPELKIANLFKHVKILKKAQKEALRIMEKDAALFMNENSFICKKLKEDYNVLTGDFTI